MRSAARRNTPRAGREVYHVVEIGEWVFHGHFSADGPYITCFGPTTVHHGHGCALGPASLFHFRPNSPMISADPPPTREQWYLVKHGNQPRVLLSGLSRRQIERLAHEFGLVIVNDDHLAPGPGPIRSFVASPAWKALRKWVAEHPRSAKRLSRFQEYLPEWYEVAVRWNHREKAAS